MEAVLRWTLDINDEGVAYTLYMLHTLNITDQEKG